jgi:hypothetical protein
MSSTNRRHGAGEIAEGKYDVKPRLKIEVVYEPHPDAECEVADALDSLAEGLADLFIARARMEVARERGVAEETIDREHERVVEAARALSPLGTTAGHQASIEFRDRERGHLQRQHVAACHLQPATSQRGNTR